MWSPPPKLVESLEPSSKARMSLKPTSKARMGLKPTRELLESLEATTKAQDEPEGPPGAPGELGGHQPEPSWSPAAGGELQPRAVLGDLPGRRRRGGGGGEEEEVEAEEEEDPHHLLVALEAVQQQLEVVEEEASRAFRRLRAKFQRQRRPHLRRRSRLIRSIPGFWVTSFLNHPQLSAIISDPRDEDALSYLSSLEVPPKTLPQGSLGCRIRFFFNLNPYFQNQEVTKEFSPGPSGRLVSSSTPIRWWQGQDPPGAAPSSPQSFFSWFGDHSSPSRDHIAQIIREQLWPNPLQFYLGGALERTPESESGEDSVVILDDDEDLEEGSSIEEVPD
ncbi:LOW QUALITY PROTEIN: testis-specific Y-encoded-like protein 1 [Melanerpes formicivorus]|uniref:LOW QUALITY PROTEIN: testis-specific Y-encoded-like protein 1 n=1 Tax=Melanerpes formicivorus TaxID=211600 RepID=UPI00358EF7DD